MHDPVNAVPSSPNKVAVKTKLKFIVGLVVEAGDVSVIECT